MNGKRQHVHDKRYDTETHSTRTHMSSYSLHGQTQITEMIPHLHSHSHGHTHHREQAHPLAAES